jgi:hypothetical protein
MTGENKLLKFSKRALIGRCLMLVLIIVGICIDSKVTIGLGFVLLFAISELTTWIYSEAQKTINLKMLYALQALAVVKEDKKQPEQVAAPTEVGVDAG